MLAMVIFVNYICSQIYCFHRVSYEIKKGSFKLPLVHMHVYFISEFHNLFFSPYISSFLHLFITKQAPPPSRLLILFLGRWMACAGNICFIFTLHFCNFFSPCLKYPYCFWIICLCHLVLLHQSR